MFPSNSGFPQVSQGARKGCPYLLALSLFMFWVFATDNHHNGITLQLSQRGFTEARTFMACPPHRSDEKLLSGQRFEENA
jgi:hypothetical protein